MVKRSGEMVTVGRIERTHGIRGELKVRIESDNPQRFTPPARFFTDLPDVPLLVLRGARSGAGRVIAEFAGVTSREAAARLVGADLLIPESGRRRLQAGEYWPDQLIGLEVRIGSGVIGTVERLIEGPQNRLAVLLSDGSSAEVPFVEALVPEVRPEEGWLRIDPPDGLLPR